MEPVWSKFDKELANIYSTYLAIKSTPAMPGQYLHPVLKNNPDEIFFTLQYNGNLQNIEGAGFKTASVEREGVANGYVILEQLGDLSAHPDVVKLVYGRRMKPSLDTSTLEILARGTTAGTNCIWSVVQSTGVFTGMTGEDIVIGIIDTGIDFRHESFQKEDSTDTRIFRIWDQGLTPIAGESGPAVSSLTGGPAYGVVYTDANINAAMATPATFDVRTKDCYGHGTHVAGIAAGNGKQKNFTSDPRFVFAGVAPKATLVIVKYLSIGPEPASTTPLKRFKDAISYILDVAGTRPVVINCSFGHDTGPHDGLVEDGTDGAEIFLESTFATVTGKICVCAAGNSASRRQHAIITIPAGGTIEVPFELSDGRNGNTNFNSCSTEIDLSPLDIDLWYNNSVAGVTASVKQPPDTDFHPAPGLAVGDPYLEYPSAANREFVISHYVTSVSRNNITLDRNNINISIYPNATSHRRGIYRVKLTGPVGAVIHVWCGQAHGYGIALAADALIPASVQLTDANTINPPAHTPSVVTVGAYDDTNDHMACFSSQGPLVDYSGSGILIDKPELSAPGVGIWSAKSFNRIPEPLAGVQYMMREITGGYTQMGGTSMAAPHITGLVALMLQKKNNQTLADIKNVLQNTARSLPQTFPATLACTPLSAGALTLTPLVSVSIGGSGKVDANQGWSIIVP
jgi:subtilisin family serine protease